MEKSTLERIQKIESFANWLDRKFTIPFIKVRIGMDGLIGLIPGIGDTLTLLISSWIVYQAHQLKASWWIKTRMIWNIFIDLLVGIVPFFGDIFDIAWQANQKNATLLSNHLKSKPPIT